MTILPAVITAQTGNVRVLLHATKPVSDSGFFSWDAWFVAPNITTAPNKWLIVTGPRLQTKSWWSEFNFGAFVQGGKVTPSIDIRTSWPSPRKFSFWTNVEWNNFSSGYFFGEANYKLPNGLGMVGIETEDNLPKTSLGPHVVIPFGSTAVTAAYQFQKEGDQLWFRLAVNFH